jgi:hypothetical protein
MRSVIERERDARRAGQRALQAEPPGGAGHNRR